MRAGELSISSDEDVAPQFDGTTLDIESPITAQQWLRDIAHSTPPRCGSRMSTRCALFCRAS